MLSSHFFYWVLSLFRRTQHELTKPPTQLHFSPSPLSSLSAFQYPPPRPWGSSTTHEDSTPPVTLRSMHWGGSQEVGLSIRMTRKWISSGITKGTQSTSESQILYLEKWIVWFDSHYCITIPIYCNTIPIYCCTKQVIAFFYYKRLKGVGVIVGVGVRGVYRKSIR